MLNILCCCHMLIREYPSYFHVVYIPISIFSESLLTKDEDCIPNIVINLVNFLESIRNIY